MSPTIIVILMVSSSALLIMLLFALRKRNKRGTIGLAATAPASLPSSEAAQIDLSSLEDLKFDESLTSSAEAAPHSAQQLEDILSLVQRYRFFQGKNLQQFETFLRRGDLQRIEQLITEKFSAQGKAEADKLGRIISEKLLSSVGV